MTNQIAKEFGLDSKDLFKQSFPKFALIEEQKYIVEMVHASLNEYIPFRLLVEIPEGTSLLESPDFLKKALRENSEAIKRYKIVPEKNILLISLDANNFAKFADVNPSFFSRRKPEKDPLKVGFVVVDQKFTLEFKFLSRGEKELKIPKIKLKTMTVQQLKQEIVKIYELGEIDLNKLVVINAGQSFDDSTKPIFDYIRPSADPNSWDSIGVELQVVLRP